MLTVHQALRKDDEGPFRFIILPIHRVRHKHDMMMYVTDYVLFLITKFTLSYDTHGPK